MVVTSLGVNHQQLRKNSSLHNEKRGFTCAVEQHVVSARSQHGQAVVNISRLLSKAWQKMIAAKDMQMILESQES